jgi:chaperonin cofactor prefoldin
MLTVEKLMKRATELKNVLSNVVTQHGQVAGRLAEVEELISDITKTANDVKSVVSDVKEVNDDVHEIAS